MSSFWQDLRYGVRVWARSPGFALLAALTLALGIGVNAAIFSVVNQLLLPPLPYDRPDRLVHLSMKDEQGRTSDSVSVPDFLDWREQSRSFKGLGLYSNASFNFTGSDEPTRLSGSLISPNLFTILGRQPALGRDFRPEEGHGDSEKVVILSHSLWESHFGGDPAVLGRQIVLNDIPRLVVGVMPAEFDFPGEGKLVWAPFPLRGFDFSRGSRSYLAMGRLGDGVSLEQARAEMNGIAARLAEQYPGSNFRSTGMHVYSLFERYYGDDVMLILRLLFLGVSFVLLIACANVANLLLARAAGRAKEIALRQALGATRWRVFRQLLTENVLLAAFGGLGGILVAFWSVEVLRDVAPPVLRSSQITLDAQSLLYTMVVALLSGLLFGLVPAVQNTRSGLNEALKEGGQRSTGGSRRWLLETLVVSEVALAIVLLASGGLMVRSFQKILLVDPGFETQSVLTLRIALPGTKYGEPEQEAQFYRRTVAEIAALPEVEFAAASRTLPLARSSSTSNFTIEGYEPADPEETASAGTVVITSDYFRVLGIPLLRGRFFTRADTTDARPVAIINETMARRFWPDLESALGKRIRTGAGDVDPRDWRTVVGVVADVRHDGLGDPPRPELYLLHARDPQPNMFIIARTRGEPLATIPSVRAAVLSVDSDQPIYGLQTMQAIVDRRMVGQRAGAQVFGFLAGLALLLAAVGVYGVLAYSVSVRTHEIGVRMALGAEPKNILRLILGRGLLLVTFGLLPGALGAYAVSRAMTLVLFGITPNDPLTYAFTAGVFLAVATLACYLPARRATRVDPMVALRYE